MTPGPLSFSTLPDRLAVCRLDPGDPLPAWASGDAFLSVTRTRDELSIVCAEELPPGEVTREDGWRALVIEGQLDFGLVGILAEVSGALASAGVSLFAISTYDTDYVLVRAARLDLAVATLRERGHLVDGQ